MRLLVCTQRHVPLGKLRKTPLFFSTPEQPQRISLSEKNRNFARSPDANWFPGRCTPAFHRTSTSYRRRARVSRSRNRPVWRSPSSRAAGSPAEVTPRVELLDFWSRRLCFRWFNGDLRWPFYRRLFYKLKQVDPGFNLKSCVKSNFSLEV